MQQHPVPQPITSYEFRLVGDMTIRQFGKLSGFLILALIVYGINPPIAFLKWFLIILFVVLGFLVAFVPFQGRPVDVWIIAFFKRIYSPTQFIWKQRNGSVNDLTLGKRTAAQATISPRPDESRQQAEKAGQIPQTPQQPPVPPVSPPAAPANTSASKYHFPPAFPPKRGTGNKIEAKFAPGVVIPAAPSFPNIVVGFIHDKDKKIIESAILEIRETNGNPVRALKSNRLGQFQTATPLPNGNYEIEVEKEGFLFDVIKIRLGGKIIPPVEIVSK